MSVYSHSWLTTLLTLWSFLVGSCCTSQTWIQYQRNAFYFYICYDVRSTSLRLYCVSDIEQISSWPGGRHHLISPVVRDIWAQEHVHCEQWSQRHLLYDHRFGTLNASHYHHAHHRRASFRDPLYHYRRQHRGHVQLTCSNMGHVLLDNCFKHWSHSWTHNEQLYYCRSWLVRSPQPWSI